MSHELVNSVLKNKIKTGANNNANKTIKGEWKSKF